VTWTGSVFVERLWRSPGEAYFTQQTLKGDRSEPVFSVLFEVQPQPDQWDAYLNYGRMLRPELERIKGFVDNVRYRSLTREGWILSLSGWRDEKAQIRWRTNANHHGAQEKGRGRVLRDYHLRVGQITRDTRLPEGQVLGEQRLDETEVGAGTTVTLIDAERSPELVKAADPKQVAATVGFMPDAACPTSWDVLEAVLSPGEVIVMATWRDQAAAETFEAGYSSREGVRLRRVRIIRDYGMFDRREAPQYYPDAPQPASASPHAQ
jgi:heme-degrading monooxygenase HmoA